MSFTLTKNTNFKNGVSGNGLTVAAGGDSGSITTIPQPGGSAVKLTDMTQQSATSQAADSTIAGGGNNITPAQVATYGADGASLGYSILGE